MAGDGSVCSAVEAELAALGVEVDSSGLAAAAVELARQMDAGNSATSKSMCARALADLMGDLRKLAPPMQGGDAIDDLAARRDARRSA